MNSEAAAYAALEYLRRKGALQKLDTDCPTLGLNVQLTLPYSGGIKTKTNIIDFSKHQNKL